ncbi:MAG: PEGA domain-containing protein [Coraliomargaritaceae bacterium]
MNFRFLLLTASLITAFSFSGCVYLRDGVPQEVTVVSLPSDADVYINGESVGTTPLSLDLPRKIVHEVRLEKEGYNTAVKYFTPVPNANSENFIKFGLSRDLGYYVDLSPSEMKQEMESDLVPGSTGSDPFDRMAKRAFEADRRYEAGVITAEEHKMIINQIIEFFEN